MMNHLFICKILRIDKKKYHVISKRQNKKSADLLRKQDLRLTLPGSDHSFHLKV